MKTVKIGSKNIGLNLPCFISLEPGATYSDVDQAKKMLDATATAKADAIKFQTFLPNDAERMMAKKDIEIEFGTGTGKKTELVYDALKRRELSENEWAELANHSKNLGLSFISAPYFSETVDFLLKIKADAIKVSKGDINNVLLIELIAKTKLPVILDAREKSEDVERALKICEKNNNHEIIIMHCPGGYPAENAGVNLSAITELQKKYDYPIGFADHSPGDVMNYAAFSLGANMIEKTITLDKETPKIEHFMSLELDQLTSFVKNIRSLEEAMGNPDILKTSRVEESARRSIVAKKDIKKGESITREMLDYRRPGNMGISCSEGFTMIEKKATKDIQKGTFLQWNMLD